MLEIAQIPVATTETGGIIAAIIAGSATVLAAIILIIVKITKPAVGTTDMWKQINSQNTTITDLQKAVFELQQQRTSDREIQLNINRVMGDGFDALSGYVRRTTAVGRKPDFTAEESDKIEKARALRDSDELWPTETKGATPS